MNQPPRLSIRLDRLVLVGVTPNDRSAVLEALQAELGRLLTDSLPTSSVTAPAVVATGNRGTSPRAIGRALARSIHHTIRGGHQ